MKRDLRKTIGNQLTLNSPPPVPNYVNGIFLDDTYV